MDLTSDIYSQFRFCSEKIDDKRTHRVLSSKMSATDLTIPQLGPQFFLSWRHIFP
jgi:hypothetical protein